MSSESDFPFFSYKSCTKEAQQGALLQAKKYSNVGGGEMMLANLSHHTKKRNGWFGGGVSLPGCTSPALGHSMQM